MHQARALLSDIGFSDLADSIVDAQVASSIDEARKCTAQNRSAYPSLALLKPHLAPGGGVHGTVENWDGGQRESLLLRLGVLRLLCGYFGSHAP